MQTSINQAPISSISLPSSTSSNALPLSQPREKRIKKSQLPITPSEFQQEQSRIELGIVRTKLKQTENELKSAKEMNDVLLANHKLFEDKRLNGG